MPLKIQNQKGFSLLEMALALLLVGILIQSITSMLIQNKQHQTYKKTEQQLQNIKQVLLSYIQINQFLPCPDTNGDGLENRKTEIIDGDEKPAECVANQGKFPYLEFGGFGQQDEFGNPFFYAININSTSTTSANNFRLSKNSASLFAMSGDITNVFFQCASDPPEPTDSNIRFSTSAQCEAYCDACDVVPLERSKRPYFNQLTGPLGTNKGNGTLQVCYDQTGECADANPPQLAASAIPLTVISFGQNGAQTWQDCSQASDREQENCDGDRYFQQQPITQDFDDQLIWITMYEIKALLSQQINWHNVEPN